MTTISSAPSGALALAILKLLASSRAVTAASNTSSAQPANPTAPSYVDDVTWLTGYLTIHSLSVNSYVYMFLFWFGIGLVILALSCATWTDVRATSLGARWQKWALRRRTWRKKHTLKKIAEEARKKGVPVSAVHRQPKSLPSNAQLLTATLVVVITLFICFVGPDYINPDLGLFDFSGSSSTSSGTTKRARLTAPINDDTMSPFIAHYNIQKSWWTSAARTGGVAFALFPLVVLLALKAPPFAIFGIPGLVQFGHDKTIRLHRYVGRLIYFVTVLHVLFWVVQVLKDKRELTGELVFAYVWKYQKFRFAWVAFLSMTILMIFSLDSVRTKHYELFYAVHVIFTPMTIIFSALHHPQRGCWIWCAIALSLWVGERLWRVCSWAYVNGVFGVKKGKGSTRPGSGSISPYIYGSPHGEKEVTMHRPIAPSRGSTTTLISSANPMNESFDGQDGKYYHENERYEMNALRAPTPRRPGGDTGMALGGDEPEGYDTTNPSGPPSTYVASKESLAYGSSTRDDESTPTPGEMMELARVRTGSSTLGGGSMRGVPLQIQTAAAPPTPMYPPAAHSRFVSAQQAQSPSTGPGSLSATSTRHLFQPHPSRLRGSQYAYAPPPGYAVATLLPGRTIRLRLVTPGYQTWAPGQHFLVSIPCVSRLTTHPFSVASVCDEQAAVHVDPDSPEAGRRLVQAESGRELVLLVRTKKGWTKRLWELVSSLQSQGLTSPPDEALPKGYTPPPQGMPGVVFRTFIDGPFGTSGRTRWGRYSSVLIVSGGSGVSFGLSVLEYVCLCIAGRDGRFLGGYPGGWGVGPKEAWITQRVRFVWLVREYAHIQWVAGSLRRCLQIVPTDALELNIFVTNHRPAQELAAPLAGGLPSAVTEGSDDGIEGGHLKPPAPRFLAGSRSPSSHGSPSEVSLVADSSVDSIVDAYFEGHDGRIDGSELGHETHLLDYTNFDGDDDTPMPGEHRLSRRINKESKVRRALTKKRESAILAKKELEERVATAKRFSGSVLPKSPEDENGYREGVAPPRSSMHSTAPLLSEGGGYSHGHNTEIPPVPAYSAFPAVSQPDHHHSHAHGHPPPSPPPPPPPSSFPFNSFSASATVNDLPPSNHPRRPLAGSGSTLPKSASASASASTPSLASSSTLAPGMRWNADSQVPVSPGDAKSWSGLSTGGALGSGLALDPQEVRDLQIVSEWARPGKPKLGKILADEVQRAKGRIAVACCGPTSLNALMRKFIAEQIDPDRVARGDMSGSIDFIAEDFEY